MSEREDFADWEQQSNSVNAWLAWQARARIAQQREAELVEVLRRFVDDPVVQHHFPRHCASAEKALAILAKHEQENQDD